MKLSGTVTVLCLACPAALAAQATGTMQVVATVTTAAPAWTGLTQAQRMARTLSADSLVAEPRRVESSLTRVELRSSGAPGGSAPPAIEIQYLRN